MRRLGAAVMAVGLLWPGAVQADPGAFVGADQFAEALWLDVAAKRFYFAMGTRTLGPDGLQTVGYVGRGRCQVYHGKNFTMISCSGSARGQKLDPGQFQFDPALGSASMAFEQDGHSHSVEWTGEDVPVAGTQAGAGGFGAEAGAGAARYAPAAGELFGTKMRTGGRNSFGVLAEGGYAVVFNEGRRVRMLDDGSIRVSIDYRIPR